MKTLFLFNTITAVVAFQSAITVPTLKSKLNPSLANLYHPSKTGRKGNKSTAALFSQISEIDSSGGEDEEKMAKKIAGRKKRVIVGYKITSFSYLLLGLVMIGMNRGPYYGMGPILVSGLGGILADAAANNRLSSDTYKRLNLCLIMSSLCSSSGRILMQGFTIEVFMAFIAIVNSIKGYGYGLKGWELKSACAKEDLLNGLKQSVQICAKVPNVRSLGYLLMFSTVGVMTATKLKELFLLIVNNKMSVIIGTRLYRLSKLLLMSVISFTLKDAADRDRLQGTTFIQLNYLISATFAALAWYLKKETTSLCIMASVFSAFSLCNGITFEVKKRSK